MNMCNIVCIAITNSRCLKKFFVGHELNQVLRQIHTEEVDIPRR